VAGVIGTWKHVVTNFLEVEGDLISRDPGPERAVVWTLDVELEAEALAVEGDRGLQVLHDEVWCNRNEVCARSSLGRPVLGILGHGNAHPIDCSAEEFRPAGPRIFDFSGALPAATSGSIAPQTFSISHTQVTQLKTGQFYFNIHTGAYGGGEIRGQILTAPAQKFVATLLGSEQVPARRRAPPGERERCSSTPQRTSSR